MKFILNFLFLLLPFSLSAQTETSGEIANELSSEHVNVEGSKISIVPPSGFIVANNFDGFQQLGTNSSIMVTEIPGPYSKVADGLTKENLKAQGVILESTDNVVVNGKTGKFLRGRQIAYGSMFNKYVLVFGDENSTIMLNGMHPLELKDELELELKNALLSVVYDEDKIIDAEGSVNYEVDVDGTKFKFAKMISNSLIYTGDGIIPTQSADKAAFMVATSLGKVEIDDKKLFSINRIMMYPTVEDLSIDDITAVTIDDISGYQIVARGTNEKTGKAKLVFQIILFSDNLYYMMIGQAEDDFEENVILFKSISKTFKRK